MDPSKTIAGSRFDRLWKVWGKYGVPMSTCSGPWVIGRKWDFRARLASGWHLRPRPELARARPSSGRAPAGVPAYLDKGFWRNLKPSSSAGARPSWPRVQIRWISLNPIEKNLEIPINSTGPGKSPEKGDHFFRKTFLTWGKCWVFNFSSFGWGKWRPVQNSGVVAKICYYISSKKQKSSRSRRLQAPNGVFECRAGAKSRQNLRKVCEKVGQRYGETTDQIVIRLTRAFREPCNGGFSPRTPISLSLIPIFPPFPFPTPIPVFFLKFPLKIPDGHGILSIMHYAS